MMNSVRNLKPVRPVHQTVRPVKPCIMHKQVEKHRKRQIPERIISGAVINPRPSPVLPRPHDEPSRHAVNRGTGKRPKNFTPNLRLQRIIQAGMATLGQPGKRAAGDEIADSDDQRHRDCGREDGERYSHICVLRHCCVSGKTGVAAIALTTLLHIRIGKRSGDVGKRRKH
jgi:hypothetical protein